ncbi:MAG: PRC-barrel domain-containing protein [Woeseiaceae bacterium]
MLLSATTLRGLKVINYDNEDLGTIEDFLPDSETGRPGFAVLSFPGGHGNGKLFAVPVRALAVAADGGEFILNADREMLKNAPGFDRYSWPDTRDPRWRSGINKYYSF